MSQSEDLLDGIRRRIRTGDLPKEYCRITWFGPGTGRICVVCDQPITANARSSDRGTIRLHQRCYDIWAAEWPTSEEG